MRQVEEGRGIVISVIARVRNKGWCLASRTIHLAGYNSKWICPSYGVLTMSFCKLKPPGIRDALRNRAETCQFSPAYLVRGTGRKGEARPSPPGPVSDSEDPLLQRTSAAPSRRKTTLEAERSGHIRMRRAGTKHQLLGRCRWRLGKVHCRAISVKDTRKWIGRRFTTYHEVIFRSCAGGELRRLEELNPGKRSEPEGSRTWRRLNAWPRGEYKNMMRCDSIPNFTTHAVDPRY